MTGNVEIRRFGPQDSVEALTALLHRAYAKHAEEGRRFFASYQSVADTAKRLAKGECWLQVRDGAVVGTVTLIGPGAPAPDFATYQMPRDAGSFSQLAIEPKLRGLGMGDALLAFTEARLGELGARQVVIDTSTLAVELIGWYARRGYRATGSWRWTVTNYDSVILSKALP